MICLDTIFNKGLSFDDIPYNMRKIYRYNPDPKYSAGNIDISQIKLEVVSYNPNELLNPGIYIIDCLIMLSNGSIMPGRTTINHINVIHNEILTSFIISPLGDIPLQKLDPDRDKFFMYKHEVISDYNSLEFISPFKYVFLNHIVDDKYEILDEVPEELNEKDTQVPLNTEEILNMPFDFRKTVVPLNNGLDYFLRYTDGAEPKYDIQYKEIYMGFKFSNTIQTVGTVYIDVKQNKVENFSILHKGMMVPLAQSTFQEVLHVDNLEDLCPMAIYNIYPDDTDNINCEQVDIVNKEALEEFLDQNEKTLNLFF